MSDRKVPKTVTLEELKEKAKEVKENRRKNAKPFRLKTLGVDLLVAPAAGQDFYLKVLEVGVGGSPVLQPDDAFMRALVKASVIEPELDDEAINAIIENSVSDFQELILFCMTMAEPTVADTKGLEAFLPGEGQSSTNTLKPA